MSPSGRVSQGVGHQQEVSGVLGRCLSSSGGVCRCREVSGVSRDTIHTSSTGPLCPPPFLEPHSLSTCRRAVRAGLAFSGGVWRSRKVSVVIGRCLPLSGGVWRDSGYHPHILHRSSLSPSFPRAPLLVNRPGVLRRCLAFSGGVWCRREVSSVSRRCLSVPNGAALFMPGNAD